MFPPSIAVDILRIMLSSNPSQDFLIWEHERKELYSVISGYRLLKQQELNSVSGESSRATTNGKVWCKLWKMDVPNKIKVFAWCFSRGSLPTQGNLAKKRIIENLEYPFCRNQSKNTFHATFECPKLAGVWQHYPSHIINQALPRSLIVMPEKMPQSF